MPDLIMVDGQGIAHPRRMGIATHLGILTDIPTIGIAKSKLCGRYKIPDQKRGSMADLTDKGDHIGYVYRSRDNVKPIFISSGHRVSLQTSIYFVEKYLNGLAESRFETGL